MSVHTTLTPGDSCTFSHSDSQCCQHAVGLEAKIKSELRFGAMHQEDFNSQFGDCFPLPYLYLSVKVD